MVQVLQSVDEKCTKSDDTLLDIIHEKGKAMKMLALSHKKQMEAKASEIDEKELKLEKIKREKESCMDQLHLFKSKYEAEMAVKNAEIEIAKKRMYTAIIERRKLETELHKLKSKYENDIAAKKAEIKSHITKQQEYERRKLLQTWLGRVVESLEEKIFEIRITRPMLFNSLFFIPIAIIAIVLLI